MQSKPETILAIDPGFDRVGVAIVSVEKGKEVLNFSCCISTSSKNPREKRLLDIGLGIREIVKKWRPKSLAIETLFFNQNTSSALGVSEARGVIIFEAMNQGLSVYEYSPQSIKIAVTGYGKATKQQVEQMVKRLIKLPDTTKKLDDEIDAIALGITHLASKKDF